jgi:hypothetical protein
LVYNEAEVGKPDVVVQKMFPSRADQTNIYRHWREFQVAPSLWAADARKSQSANTGPYPNGPAEPKFHVFGLRVGSLVRAGGVRGPHPRRGCGG